jgi:hypothetical protein
MSNDHIASITLYQLDAWTRKHYSKIVSLTSCDDSGIT